MEESKSILIDEEEVSSRFAGYISVVLSSFVQLTMKSSEVSNSQSLTYDADDPIDGVVFANVVSKCVESDTIADVSDAVGEISPLVSCCLAYSN
jgi:phosphoenolpyruvate synthase/pyruvate phosphate dikinase